MRAQRCGNSGAGLLKRKRRVRQASVDACRAAIWRELLSRAPRFIRHEDSPVTSEVARVWVEARSDTWVIPEAFDRGSRRPQRGLVPGGWAAYAAAAVLDDLGELWTTTADAVQWAETYRVSLIIQAYWDDRDWRVQLTPQDSR